MLGASVVWVVCSWVECLFWVGHGALLGFGVISSWFEPAWMMVPFGCLILCVGLLFENYIVDASIFWNLRMTFSHRRILDSYFS